MLLEGEMQHTLNFEINKDLTLRTYLGPQEFRELALTAVRVLGDTEQEACVLILDKITETRQVMDRLIQMQVQQINKTKPIDFVSPSLANDPHKTKGFGLNQYED
jgi:hypothetical protein